MKADEKQDGFTITFWIWAADNPSWLSDKSNTRFTPVTLKGGVQVYSAKYGNQLRIFVLHPDYGYRKLVAEVTNYLGRDTFVALTVNGRISTLYLNGELVCETHVDEMIKKIEHGDFVMAKVKEGDLKSLSIGKDVEVIFPAEVKTVKADSITLNFFEIKEIVTLPKDRIAY